MGTARCTFQRPEYIEGLPFNAQDCSRLADSACPWAHKMFRCHVDLFFGRSLPEQEDKVLSMMHLLSVMVPGGASYPVPKV